MNDVGTEKKKQVAFLGGLAHVSGGLIFIITKKDYKGTLS